MKKFISFLLYTASIVPANAGRDNAMIGSLPHYSSIHHKSNPFNKGLSSINL